MKLRTIPLRLRSLFRRNQVEVELDEELRYHVERQTADYIAKGLTPEEARRTALLAMGGIDQRKEDSRDTWRVAFIDDLVKDIRYAIRMMWINPGFTFTTVLMVALGIGVNTTVFSAYNAIALKPLPVADPRNVVRIERWFERSRGDLQFLFSYPEYAFVRDNQSVLTTVVAASWSVPIIASVSQGSRLDSAEPETLQGQLVSANYFAALGIDAQIGRTFGPDADRSAEGNAVVVLSHSFWRRRFHEDPRVIGETIRNKNAVLTVIGIAPKEFNGTSAYPQVSDFWAPLSMQSQLTSGRDWRNEPGDLRLELLGRLSPSVTREAAQTQIDTLVRRFEKTYTPREKTALVTLEHAALFGQTNALEFKALVAALMVVVGLILLAGCANIANMLLARGVTRRREIGIRLSLGAGRRRIVRQLLTESLLLSLLGGVAGLMLAVWISKLLWAAIRQMATPVVGGLIDVNLDLDFRVFAYALSLAVVTGILFGLSPALQATKSELITVMKGEVSFHGRVLRSRLRGFLVAAQVTISLLFLLGAGLLVRGLLRSQGADVGYETRNVFVLAADFGENHARGAALQQRLVQRLQTLAEIKDATTGYGPLFGTWTPPINVNGVSDRTLASYASNRYFSTLGIPLIRGRDFTEREAHEGAPLAVISESAARRFWAGQDPLQKHFKLNLDFRGVSTDFEVIGIAKDVRFANPTRLDPAHVYLTPRPGELNRIMFRTEGSPSNAIAAVKKTVESVDENLLPKLELFTLEQGPLFLHRTLMRALAWIVMVLAFIALTIASIGIYGVMAHLVNQRVKEIGIRVALGATPMGVLRTVVVLGLKPVFAGLVLGGVGGLALSWLLQFRLTFPGSSDFFYGLPFYDPVAFIGLPCFLTVVAASASLFPARRALRVDPVVALRHD